MTETRGISAAAWWRHDCRLNIRELPATTLVCDHCGARKPSTATEHEAGCTYGGFSCGYWLRVEGCPEYHPETHLVTDDRCPCGHEFPGFGTGKAVSDAEDKELPVDLRQGLGTPIELEFPDA